MNGATTPGCCSTASNAYPGCGSPNRDATGKDGVVLDHLSIQCADVAASAAFYDAVLAPVGGTRIMDFGEVIGYG